MKELNNKDIIKNLLKFNKEGDIYYYVQIIQRRKENPSLTKGEIKRYGKFITGPDELDLFFPEIKQLCDFYKSRAYISITPRSLEKYGKRCLLEFSIRNNSGDWGKVYSITNSIALSKDTIKSRGIVNKPRWMIDLDTTDNDSLIQVKNFIKNHTEVVETVPTINGYHLIIDAFNIKEIKNFMLNDSTIIINDIKFDLFKTANTILYANY